MVEKICYFVLTLQSQMRFYRCYIGTAGNDFPGVPKMGGIHLQLVVAAHQVVVDVPIKVTTQTTHPTLHTR